jgi:glycogen debranching enzyme
MHPRPAPINGADDGHRGSQAFESVPLPATTVTLVEGASFAITDPGGDIGSAPVEGIFVGDTRICSQAVIFLDDRTVEPLSYSVRDPSSAVFVGRSVDRRLLIFRDLRVGQGMRLDLRIRDLGHDMTRSTVRLALGADLAHVFDVKRGETPGPAASCTSQGSSLHLSDEDGRSGVVIRGGGGARAGDDASLTWELELEQGQTWQACVEFSAVREGAEIETAHPCGAADGDGAEPRRRRPQRTTALVTSDVPGLAEASGRAEEDLDALRLIDPHHPEDMLVAAGAPWYMTLFGRDSLLTSWMALPVDPDLALGSVRTLARMQGRREDPATEEQAGRILHEVRPTRGTSLALSDGDVYYGTVDATPLFVMLVHELWRWGAPLDEITRLRPAVDAALEWLAGPGDPDGDGYVEYAPPASAFLSNQGWKDSHDAISFADGRLAATPIALAEVQAYAYAAWRAGASLARAGGDEATASEHDRRAEELRERFERDFWLEDLEAFALGLDGDKRPIDAVTSNMGHALWAGIVADERKAAAIARWLVSPELFTGWGVRTLATSMGRYSPLSYHNGSVWPHDTAICIEGLRRYGFVEEAQTVASGLLAAAAALDGRLPELFAGLTREEMPIPVRYPTSCSPQAWASAAPLLLVRASLALDPDVPNGRIELDPALPPGSRRLRVEHLELAGSRVTIDVEGDAIDISNLPRELAVIRPPD